MTRPYPHRPAVDVAERRFTVAAAGVGRALATVDRRGFAPASVVRAALDPFWEALAWGWLLERPLAELRALVPPAVTLVRAALDRPGDDPRDLWDVERSVTTALLAGDDDAAVRAASLTVAPPAQEADAYPATLAALVRRDDDAAARDAATLRAVADTPTTAPDTVDALAHLGDVADAVLRGDQTALDGALAARAEAVARAHTTEVMRRRWHGVLDRSAVGLALAGSRRGLRVPAGIAVVPAELLAAVRAAGPGGTGGTI